MGKGLMVPYIRDDCQKAVPMAAEPEEVCVPLTPTAVRWLMICTTMRAEKSVDQWEPPEYMTIFCPAGHL